MIFIIAGLINVVLIFADNLETAFILQSYLSFFHLITYISWSTLFIYALKDIIISYFNFYLLGMIAIYVIHCILKIHQH